MEHQKLKKLRCLRRKSLKFTDYKLRRGYFHNGNGRFSTIKEDLEDGDDNISEVRLQLSFGNNRKKILMSQRGKKKENTPKEKFQNETTETKRTSKRLLNRIPKDPSKIWYFNPNVENDIKVKEKENNRQSIWQKFEEDKDKINYIISKKDYKTAWELISYKINWIRLC
ncbi:MAG: hypothetical protein Ta2E_10770 [Mycoplasmoidaceae bacterium]|nr:MAG: hypothetical protein Ta2E_10770 [Mycoplasmoidaceae bacterium]